MADSVTFQTTPATVPSGTKVATDDAGAAGQVQLVKLANPTDGSAAAWGDGAAGLPVQVTNPWDVQGGEPVESSASSSSLTTASTLYSNGDQMGAIVELTGLVASAADRALLTSAVLLSDKESVIGPVRVWFFSASVTVASDNAAFSLTDADAAKCVGTVTFPNPAGTVNNAIATLTGIDLDVQCVGTTSLWAAFQTLTDHASHFAAADDLHLFVRARRL